MRETYRGADRGADEQLNQHLLQTTSLYQLKVEGEFSPADLTLSLSFFLSPSLSVCVFCWARQSGVTTHSRVSEDPSQRQSNGRVSAVLLMRDLVPVLCTQTWHVL